MKKNFLLLIATLGCTITTTIASCSTCGDDWISFKNIKCFKILPQLLTRQEAALACKNEDPLDSRLASINSSEEQDFLTKLLGNIQIDMWFGLKRINSKPSQTPFVWNDGSPVSYENWVMDRPFPEPFGEQCFQMSFRWVAGSGKWQEVPCTKRNYALCEKPPKLGLGQLRNLVQELNDLLNKTIDDLTNTKNELMKTKTELENTRIEVIKKIDDGKIGIDGAFSRTFEVGGEDRFYYPVAIKVASEHNIMRSPLPYDIYRFYNDKAPESLNTGTAHYMGLTLKLLVSDGGWDAGSNQCKVIFHDWIYNKGVGKVQIFPSQEYRLFVWLRGGGVLYHIRSPVDLADAITIYYEKDAEATPPYDYGAGISPANIVNPIPIGGEDENLIKPGVYVGWAF